MHAPRWRGAWSNSRQTAEPRWRGARSNSRQTAEPRWRGAWSGSRSGSGAARPRFADVRALLGDPRLRLVLAIATLHWICLSPYNVYFGVFLHDLGLHPLTWGLAYSAGVVTEVFVLMTFHRLQARFTLPTSGDTNTAFLSFRLLIHFTSTGEADR